MQKEKQAENMASVLNTSKLSVLREIWETNKKEKEGFQNERI
jgi:hypothetical protein